MELAVCTWNLFHGRTRPATHADLASDFAAALSEYPWDVCALQEAPPWWTRQLAEALGASARGVRTSLTRGALPAAQEAVHRRSPETIGVRGAAANVLLVRPSAGDVVDHRVARLRRAPQRRTVHAVRLRRPSGEHWWVANVHTHNRPESAAAADTIRALAAVEQWAGTDPSVLLGDLNLATPEGLARVQGWEHLHGHRVDHILGRGVAPASEIAEAAAPADAAGAGQRAATGGTAAGAPYAEVARLPGGPELSDHRIVGLTVARRY